MPHGLSYVLNLFKPIGAAVAAILLVGGSVAAAGATDGTGTGAGAQQLLRGTLVHRVAEFGTAPDTDSWLLNTRSGLVPLALSRGTSVAPGATVTVRGSASLGGALSVSRNGLRAVSVTTAGDTPSTPTSMHLAVILFTLPDAPKLAVTTAQTRAIYFGAKASAASFYTDASNGAFSLSGDVVGPYALTGVEDATCDVNDWASAASAAATDAGIDLSGYTNVAFAFPWVSACPWAGMADVSGPDSYMNGLTPGDLGVYHASHELGHNLGSGHAHAYDCVRNGTPESIGPASDCSIDEYGDPFSVMGTGVTRLPNGWERLQMGFLPSSSEQVISGAGTRRVRLSVLEQTGGTRLLRVERADGSYLDVEYRQPFGTFDDYSASDPAVRGVTLELVPDGASAETSLLDATPGTPTFDDATLTAGRNLTDADGGVSISVLSTDASGATLDVTIVAMNATDDADSSAPLAPAGLSAAQAPGGVDLAWQPALDNVGATDYQVSRDGHAIGQTSGLTFDDAGAAGTPHAYDVTATDAAGNIGPAATAQFTPRDHTAPSSPGPISVRRMSATSLQAKWALATDNTSVARYRIQVDGGTPTSTTRLSATLKSLTKGTHKISIWAVDQAGNVGPAARVTFRG